MSKILAVCLTLTSVSALMTGAAHAQAGGDHTQTLSDVVVTAQRREERLQSVPIAVNVVTAKQMAVTGIVSTDDLGKIVPGLVSSRALNNGTIFLRGMGTQNAGQGDENGVALYVDGVYIFSPVSSIFQFNNIERIEVLRGPQGTLFGRNAVGGLIQVVTKNPTHTPSLELGVGYDNYDTVNGDLYGSTGIAENLAADLSVHYSHQGQGYGRNIFLNRDVNKTNEFAVRTKWVFDPSDDTSIAVALDYSKLNSDRGITRSAYPGSFLPGGVVAQPELLNVSLDLTPSRQTEQRGASLHIKHSMAFADFVSISAYRNDDSSFVFDNDAKPIFGAHVFSDSLVKTYSQELQLVSNGDSALQWIGGLYYLHASAANTRFASTTPTAYANRVSEQVLKTYSAFAQGSYKLTPQTTATVGVRYTDDKRSLEGVILNAAGALTSPAISAKKSWDAFTWRASLDHQFTDTVMAYASYNRGFKGGVYNQTNPAQAPVSPQTIDAFELGLKTDLMDRRVRFNSDVFYYKASDIQLQANTVAVPPATLLVNAASAKVYGYEAELNALVTDELTLIANLSVLHSEYSDFPNAPVNIPNATPLPGGNRAGTINATGNRLMRTPNLAYNITAQYRLPVGDGAMTFTATWAHNGSMYWEPDNRLKQPAYDVVNGSIVWAPAGDRWSVRVWGKNLTDERYFSYALSSVGSGDTGAVADPRTYGVALQMKF